MSYYPDDDDERKTLKRKMIYALVARDNDVLVEHTFKGLTGNFSVVTRALLKRLPDQSQMSLRHNDYSFHYIISSSNIIYLCMADLTFDRLQCFSFLKQVQQQFERKYGDKAQTAIAYAFNSDFKSVLSQYMSDVNTRPTKMEAVQSSLDEVKDVMVRNIEHVLENGEAIDLLVDKSTELDQHAFKFKKSSRGLSRMMWWKNIKLIILLVLVIAAIFYAILASACGGADLPNC